MNKNRVTFTPSFSLLEPSAKALYLNISTFAGLFAIILVFNILANFSEAESSTRRILETLGTIAGIIAAPALVIAQLESAKGKQIEFVQTFKNGIPLILRMLLLQLAIFFGVIGGLVLFIVPGIFILQRLILAPYFLVDQ